MQRSNIGWSFVVAIGIGVYASALAWAEEPRNLAPKAKVSATSEYNAKYQARFAIDEKIPTAGSHAADLSAAWCVLKEKSGDQADFSLEWPKPIDVSQVVYWGRTAWHMNECWKDFEVYLDDVKEPVVRGTFRAMHGPQPIAIEKTRVKKLTLRFLNSYGGPNPGAAEIQVFDEPLAAGQLAKFVRSSKSKLNGMPWVEEHDPAAVRQLIEDLSILHGERYTQRAEHLARLELLEKLEPSDAQAWEQLERDVLLFDIDRIVVIKRHEITASHVYTYHYEGFRAGGGLYIVSLRDPQGEPIELVPTPTGQILDFDVSHDGRVILFSWRRTKDEGYHLWTINADGTNLKQLTDGVWHDYNACWLPSGQIAFLTTRAPQFAYCWHAPVGILHRMNADGSNLIKLSSNYLNDFTPSVLEDGRLIYTRWEYVDRPAIPIQSMWTLNPDGSGLAAFFGNRVLSPGTFMEARSIPGTSKVICTMTGHNGPTRGAIGVIDRTKGVNSQSAIENVTPDVPIPEVDQGNGNMGGTKQYSGPRPLDSKRFLVSARGPLLVRTLSGECQSLALESPPNGMQWLGVQPLATRKRARVIPDSRREATDEATVFLQDVYNGLSPYVQRGEVKTIRVVRELQKTVRIDPKYRAFGFQFPVISCGATYAGKQVFGDVEVEPDGSVAFRVPSETPIYFIALDADGRAVQRMRSFTHFMPGEVQGCVGCHEHRRQTVRTDMITAFNRPPKSLTPPEWGVGGFDYSRVVQPVLDAHCTECHNPAEAPGGIDLSAGKTDFFNVSYDVLARENQGGRGSPFVNWIPSYNGQEQNILETRPRSWGSPVSLLADLVLSGHPDADGKRRVDLDEKSRRRIFSWIDLNVPYYGSSETAYPEATGCRRIHPPELDRVLAEVATRRCVPCHDGGKVPRREWTRITEPEQNPFLLAPLARSAGGNEKCGKAIFADRDDVDYRAILATFDGVQQALSKRPRMDMEGGKPAEDVCRICQ